MAITASDVKELRERTGAGMMDCKKALTETNGDIEKAIDFLREKGLASAAKKAGRIASEGLVEAYIHAGGKIAKLILWPKTPNLKIFATMWQCKLPLPLPSMFAVRKYPLSILKEKLRF